MEREEEVYMLCKHETPRTLEEALRIVKDTEWQHDISLTDHERGLAAQALLRGYW